MNHSILAVSGVIFAIGIVLLVLANGNSGKTMRRMGLILSGCALIAFTLFFFLDVLPTNT